MPTKPSEAEILSYFEKLSNWGRWGKDDELGTANLITAQKRKQAIETVTEGTTISCARPIAKEAVNPGDLGQSYIHFMSNSGEKWKDVKQDEGVFQFSTDFIGFNFHGHSMTHMDALSHIFWGGKGYNGFPAEMCATREGAIVDSIAVLGSGVTTRGVLLDIPRLKGLKWLEKEPGVFPEDLEAAEAAQGVRVEPGDLLFMRTGYLHQYVEEGAEAADVNRTGYQAACLPWLRERDIAVLGCDTAQDIVPSGYGRVMMPVHQVGIVAMGVWVIDNANLEDLAKECERLNRWEFLITVNPLRIEGATGCPVNPVAVF